MSSSKLTPPPDSLRETVYFLIVSCCFFEGRLGVPFSIWSDLQFETRDKEVIRQNMTAGFEQNNMWCFKYKTEKIMSWKVISCIYSTQTQTLSNHWFWIHKPPDPTTKIQIWN